MTDQGILIILYPIISRWSNDQVYSGDLKHIAATINKSLKSYPTHGAARAF